MNKLLLIPNAGLVPEELRADFGPISSGMIPLDGKPALYHIARPYLEAGFDLAIGAQSDLEAAEGQCRRWAAGRFRYVDVGATPSIGATVHAVLAALETPPDRLVVNFADTLHGDTLGGDDEVRYRLQEDTYRWTAFDFGESHTIGALYAKHTLKPECSALPIFVGVAGFARPKDFHECLRSALDSAASNDDPFWNALVAYHNQLPLERRRLLPAHAWSDLGHLDTYYRAKRQFFLSKRFFNDLRVDADRGILRKASANAAKLSGEVEWYLSLPESLRCLAPRVFDYQPGTATTAVEMEFYGYPALNDSFVQGRWDPGVWSQVFRAIGHAIDLMSQHTLDRPAHELCGALNEMYERKTLERLAPVLQDPRFAPLACDQLTINGRDSMGLSGCLRSLPDALKSSGIYHSPHFSIIHGDLCLSNILYDRRAGFVRLIDPRGTFGGFRMYGDPRYDLAKLCHSLLGGYDFILNGLFEYSCGRDGVKLTLDTSPHHDVISRLFRQWIMRRAGKAYGQVRLLESLLFLSMVPLHSDRPDAQIAFLTRGLELYTAALDRMGLCTSREGVHNAVA